MILSNTPGPTAKLSRLFMNSRSFTNFGGNQSFRPKSVYAPRSEVEVLDVLRLCRGRRIRTIGRLHSWSEAAVANDVLIDLRYLREVRVEDRGGRQWVTVGGGCQIQRLLAELARQADRTLPSLGSITEQSIAGAISTGTHGSGKSSMSHFIEEVRVANYDPATGEPTIRTIDRGDELWAARCALGTLGVIVSVGFWSLPRYRVEECFRQYENLESVLATEGEFQLQHFFLMPWRWRYIAQHRRETVQPRGGWASLYRMYFFLQFDIGLHLLVRLAARTLRSPMLVRLMFRQLASRMVIKNWNVIDDSNKMLVMEHELFQHIECEMFVAQPYLPESTDLVVKLLKYFDGDREALDSEVREQLQRIGLMDELQPLCGIYTHHYPICFRRVMPDDTLISMTSGDAEPWYALSFISYEKPAHRKGFLAFARVLSRALGTLFGARPHWGKVCPLTPEEAARLYPQLPKFRDICALTDPDGIFRNDWITHTLFANGET
jgi:L-gulono-1,4-lactone dehydrogenase